ncbi:Eco57I restriction-modification methylase domain-containing protein [Amycolatopsis sp. NPDC049868]|uniref:Eco57I restriction-modification methylase domain-containing protein n=1 Tax=Amycolatopsis sp. NPDC049868 TaxID=3363934 RepID=UPI00379524A2
MTTRELFDLDALQLPEALVDAVEHGEVFTRRWVVETILDLVGYTVDRDLADLRAVEPACGAGAFLGPMVERLSESCRRQGRSLLDAAEAVQAFDLLDQNVRRSRELLTEQLVSEGWESDEVRKVVDGWVTQGDYLFQDCPGQSVDFVVGNPPYVRLEDVPDARMSAYRKVCPTMGGRADLYVGFYEVGLRSLKPGGRLGFICADRWMRNQYGRGLRQLVASRYSMDLVLVMHDVDAFEEQVSAYPAITIIGNDEQGEAVAADTTEVFGAEQAKRFLTWVNSSAEVQIDTPAFHAARLPHWFSGDDSWPAGSPARLAMLEDLTDRFAPLEDKATGTRVGIGIATGADKVFVTDDPEGIDVEPDRLLRLSMVRDTRSGALRWHGAHLINPWTPEGGLVNLKEYPRLARYFARSGQVLRKRHVAVKQPDRWYKTIDKVDHGLTAREKLLFPDMKLTIHPVLDEGGFYPHHNLYFIVSDAWDMRVLGGLLLSRVAQAFVAAYAVKMRGGTLRFQAQYLRRIRVPDPTAITADDKVALAEAFDARDVEAATVAALRVYGLTELPD